MLTQDIQQGGGFQMFYWQRDHICYFVCTCIHTHPERGPRLALRLTRVLCQNMTYLTFIPVTILIFSNDFFFHYESYMHSPYEMPISDPGMPSKHPGKRSDELNPWALRRGWRISFLCSRLQPSLKCSQETPAPRQGQPEPPHRVTGWLDIPEAGV